MPPGAFLVLKKIHLEVSETVEVLFVFPQLKIFHKGVLGKDLMILDC